MYFIFILYKPVFDRRKMNLCNVKKQNLLPFFICKKIRTNSLFIKKIKTNRQPMIDDILPYEIKEDFANKTCMIQ